MDNCTERHHFGLAPLAKWKLAPSVSRRQRERILASTSFREIVANLKPESVFYLEKEQFQEDRNFIRYEIRFQFSDPAVIDCWHNGRGGIRAQYYLDPTLGEAAELYAIRKLFPLLERLSTNNANLFPHSFNEVQSSLLDPYAKIRIWPGKWIRCPRRGDCQLLVPEWADVWQECGTKWGKARSDERLLARRGALIPSDETRLFIKGGWINNKTGRSYGGRAKGKTNRPLEWQKFGFN